MAEAVEKQFVQCPEHYRNQKHRKIRLWYRQYAGYIPVNYKDLPRVEVVVRRWPSMSHIIPPQRREDMSNVGLVEAPAAVEDAEEQYRQHAAEQKIPSAEEHLHMTITAARKVAVETVEKNCANTLNNLENLIQLIKKQKTMVQMSSDKIVEDIQNGFTIINAELSKTYNLFDNTQTFINITKDNLADEARKWSLPEPKLPSEE